ncbi:hypothetical protein PT974_03122 [Cladobotryum mycophilum]|uniref:Serine aminopeptidase S33 domain-containing protein n=1 Tax=Cladobotryum mycophilum TaxID=491253 RepID=A0ABR0SRJ7_9HYPO
MLLAIFLHLGLSAALQGSNFNVSKSVAAEYNCGPVCYDMLQKTNAEDLDVLGTAFDFDFYNTASNFTNSEPGDLLKMEAMDPRRFSSDIPWGATYYRIQYTSIDIDGHKVPVTGFIAIPFIPNTYSNNTDKKVYRTIAYAHGTLGLFHGCAPSTSPKLYDYQSWSTLVAQGYAIVATDYSGLGNNHTQHKYITLPEHANDIFYSVVAAKKAFPNNLSDEWLSIGHSQGGGAVWKLAESDLIRSNEAKKAGRYLGTVSIAPVTKVYDMAVLAAKTVFNDPKQIHKWVITGEVALIGIAVKRLIPSYNMSIYGDVLRKRIELSELTQGCSLNMMGMTVDLDVNEILSPKDLWQENIFQQFQSLTGAGQGHLQQPMLVIQGLNDTAVLPDSTVSTYHESCTIGNAIQLKLFNDLDHTTVIPASAPLFIDWINTRFNNGARATHASTGACSQETFPAWDANHMNAPKEADELEL